MKRLYRYGNLDDIALGKEIVSRNEVGVLVLAGGDGTRLGWSGPKGTFPIVSEEKTLFHYLYRSMSCDQKDRFVCCALMTSTTNHRATKEALDGIAKDWCHIFSQESYPLLDEMKKPLEVQAPNGNGKALHSFVASGLYDLWVRDGIKYLQIVPIDNPLGYRLDPNFIGCHVRHENDITIKVILRSKTDRSVGILNWTEEGWRVTEYITDKVQRGNHVYTGLCLFSMDVILEIIKHPLPLHLVKKSLHHTVVWKQEHFLFDTFPYVSKIALLQSARRQCFAPLKSEKDIVRVQKALASFETAEKNRLLRDKAST